MLAKYETAHDLTIIDPAEAHNLRALCEMHSDMELGPEEMFNFLKWVATPSSVSRKMLERLTVLQSRGQDRLACSVLPFACSREQVFVPIYTFFFLQGARPNDAEAIRQAEKKTEL